MAQATLDNVNYKLSSEESDDSTTFNPWTTTPPSKDKHACNRCDVEKFFEKAKEEIEKPPRKQTKKEIKEEEKKQKNREKSARCYEKKRDFINAKRRYKTAVESDLKHISPELLNLLINGPLPSYFVE